MKKVRKEVEPNGRKEKRSNGRDRKNKGFFANLRVKKDLEESGDIQIPNHVVEESNSRGTAENQPIIKQARESSEYDWPDFE